MTICREGEIDHRKEKERKREREREREKEKERERERERERNRLSGEVYADAGDDVHGHRTTHTHSRHERE